MELTLMRSYFPQGTNGALFLDGKKICSTIELPWKENQRRISCIPEGKYALQQRYSLRFGYHLLVKDVPNRSYILIHAYNHALKESKGCIAPVSECTGEGEGIFSRMSLKTILDLTSPAFKRNEPVFLTIQS